MRDVVMVRDLARIEYVVQTAESTSEFRNMLSLLRGSDYGRGKGTLDFMSVQSLLGLRGAERRTQLGVARDLTYHGVRFHTPFEHRDRLAGIAQEDESVMEVVEICFPLLVSAFLHPRNRLTAPCNFTCIQLELSRGSSEGSLSVFQAVTPKLIAGLSKLSSDFKSMVGQDVANRRVADASTALEPTHEEASWTHAVCSEEQYAAMPNFQSVLLCLQWWLHRVK
eukprot:1621063-Amphidinium_carterae.1